jgi:serine/threonine protein kinase
MGAEKHTSLDLREVLDLEKVNADLSIPLEALPRQYITGEIRVRKSWSNTTLVRSKIQYIEPPLYRGGQGLIRRALRTLPFLENTIVATAATAATAAEPSPIGICVKCPQVPTISLSTEALIQWLAATTLEQRAGIIGAVPKVYDLFQYAGETRFSMEYVDGVSAAEYIATTPAAATDGIFLQILAQTALLLSILQQYMRLDHRDLKGDNLWIRPRPISYTVKLKDYNASDIVWRVEAPFQVVLLDFGFACIGGEDGNAVVSLSDGLLPAIDPCPKEGRDMLQLVASFWFLPCIRERLSPEMRAYVTDLLSYKGANHASTVQKMQTLDWLYMKGSEREFRYPPLEPIQMLKSLSDNWKGVGVLQRV